MPLLVLVADDKTTDRQVIKKDLSRFDRGRHRLLGISPARQPGTGLTWSLEPLDHGDRITDRVEGHFVHERADQEQAPAADSDQVFVVYRLVEPSGIEAGALVADNERSGMVIDTYDDADPPRRVGLSPASSFGLIEKEPLVFLPKA